MEVLKSIFVGLTDRTESVVQHSRSGISAEVTSLDNATRRSLEERLTSARARFDQQIHKSIKEQLREGVANPLKEFPSDATITQNLSASEISEAISDGIRGWRDIFFPEK